MPETVCIGAADWPEHAGHPSRLHTTSRRLGLSCIWCREPRAAVPWTARRRVPPNMLACWQSLGACTRWGSGQTSRKQCFSPSTGSAAAASGFRHPQPRTQPTGAVAPRFPVAREVLDKLPSPAACAWWSSLTRHAHAQRRQRRCIPLPRAVARTAFDAGNDPACARHPSRHWGSCSAGPGRRAQQRLHASTAARQRAPLVRRFAQFAGDSSWSGKEPLAAQKSDLLV